ncbi:unnamed protein product, partial [Scytosiphon promiscuus]
GLRLPGSAREKMMDTIQARYDLARGSCSQFMLTQYGICCFRYTPGDGGSDRDDGSGEGGGSGGDGHLEARPFNCYVAPSTSFGSDRVYSCQASSMNFLSKHGFDFQAWASHGVPFLSREEEKAVMEKLEARDAVGAEPAAVRVHTSRDGTTIESLQEPEKGMVKDALKKVEALLKESSGDGEYVQRSVKLGPMNGRQRWLMYEFVGSSSPSIKLANLPGPADAKPMEIRTLCDDPEGRAKMEAKLRADERERQLGELRRAVGFRRVLDVLFEAGKPVICHNGLLDLLHTYNKFVGPIPEGLDEGTRALHALLPRLFDSKVVMAKAVEAGMRFPRTVLGEAHGWLREKFPRPPPPPEPTLPQGETNAKPADAASNTAPAAAAAAAAADGLVGTGEANDAGGAAANGTATASAAAAAAVRPSERLRRRWDAVFAPGFEERYGDGGQEHEAGYDAYLTGCCFAAAAAVGLGVGVDELRGLAAGGAVPPALAPFQGVVPLFRMFAGQQLHLPGPAPSVDLSRYAHVSGFPPAARTDSVMAPIKAVGGGCEDAWFFWIDETSGVADCKSEQGVETLLEAAAAAAAAAANAFTPAAESDASGGAAGDGGDGGSGGGGDGTALGGGEEPKSVAQRVVDPLRLTLEDLTIVRMDSSVFGDNDNGNGGVGIGIACDAPEQKERG